jgi:hypothetical protein
MTVRRSFRGWAVGFAHVWYVGISDPFGHDGIWGREGDAVDSSGRAGHEVWVCREGLGGGPATLVHVHVGGLVVVADCDFGGHGGRSGGEEQRSKSEVIDQSLVSRCTRLIVVVDNVI